MHTQHTPWHLQVEAILGICHLLVYIILTTRLLADHTRAIKESFAALEKVNLAWIKNLIMMFGVVWIFYITVYIFDAGWLIHILGVLVVGMIYYMGFKGLTQPEIFAKDEEQQPAPEYAKTALAPDKAKTYLEKLQHFMETEKPFIESDLSLQKLAIKLAIPAHHLSQIINEQLQQNFLSWHWRRVHALRWKRLDHLPRL